MKELQVGDRVKFEISRKSAEKKILSPRWRWSGEDSGESGIWAIGEVYKVTKCDVFITCADSFFRTGVRKIAFSRGTMPLHKRLVLVRRGDSFSDGYSRQFFICEVCGYQELTHKRRSIRLCAYCSEGRADVVEATEEPYNRMGKLPERACSYVEAQQVAVDPEVIGFLNERVYTELTGLYFGPGLLKLEAKTNELALENAKKRLRARIARNKKWPACSVTGRNVDLLFDITPTKSLIAEWVCNHCNKIVEE